MPEPLQAGIYFPGTAAGIPLLGSTEDRARGLVLLLRRARDRGEGLSLTVSGVESILWIIGQAEAERGANDVR